jgi:hypothetical protein
LKKCNAVDMSASCSHGRIPFLERE